MKRKIRRENTIRTKVTVGDEFSELFEDLSKVSVRTRANRIRALAAIGLAFLKNRPMPQPIDQDSGQKGKVQKEEKEPEKRNVLIKANL